MSSTTEAPRKSHIKKQLGGCGGCTYTYNQTDGCYHRQKNNCTGGCTCSPLVCGLAAQVIRLLKPKTASAAATPVSLTCLQTTSEEEWCARALYDLATGKSSPAAFWRRVSVGLGALSGVLAIGLVVSMMYR